MVSQALLNHPSVTLGIIIFYILYKGASFVISRATGAIIGEYAKEAHFKKFRDQRREALHKQALAERALRELEIDLEYAKRIIVEQEAIIGRLMARVVIAERASVKDTRDHLAA